MKLDVTTLEGAAAGSVDLSDAIFGLEPRVDLIHRVVRYQLAKRQAGTHATLLRSEINRTKKKLYKQKGTGGARHGHWCPTSLRHQYRHRLDPDRRFGLVHGCHGRPRAAGFRARRFLDGIGPVGPEFGLARQRTDLACQRLAALHTRGL